ncbi:RsmB/NOP family class I SAM-dependent RNA methyltransferase [Pseudooctadecabacter sp.]|uniref:RsmB/NOP family class I SAM-dependent RNA methyltransferase n=1 Tax=Pseudooctadecabacter sp. TaxID=1966338 RepID=UPI0025FDF78F|nr:RsmB/NOP family class I SAM-dependent RNA methyltransferase [Pseudooctadecabacter sp.]
MTPAARVAAAIEVLDDILSGQTAEKALTGWGRAHRFAGSKDRAAIRDHVFQALRCRASYAWLGGADTGRGIMLGAMRSAGLANAVFTGEGHAPPPVTDDEAMRPLAQADRATRLDCPDWMLPLFEDRFGTQADDVLTTLQSRAGVFLRVNTRRCSVPEALASLAHDDIDATAVDGVATALRVLNNERRVAQSGALAQGWVEVQDASSQAAIAAADIGAGSRWLDYCAGGGGKALALADHGADVTAHDIDPLRMRDLPSRAARAGVTIAQTDGVALRGAAPFDGVFCDAPCSGSGTWRRTPEAKWALTPDRLETLTRTQDEVLRAGAAQVKPGGMMIYATCSVFRAENEDRVAAFLTEQGGFDQTDMCQIAPHSDGDGFFWAHLRKR